MTLKPIAYVQAAWHTDITDHCRTAFMAEVVKHGYGAGDVEFFSVPGSLEIPLMARKLAQTGRYAAVCASGLVVNGGIYRHDFVAQAVLHGIVQASLETDVPVLSRWAKILMMIQAGISLATIAILAARAVNIL